MAEKKTIAIVGATEQAGTEITCQFLQTNYRLLLISNDTYKLDQLLKRIAEDRPKAEIDSLECVKDGCWQADIIVLAVPSHEEELVAEMMKEVATQKIVVSISGTKKIEEELKKVLPYSKLVMVSGISGSKNISVGGNNAAANEEVSHIFLLAGYHTDIVNGAHVMI